MAAPRSAPAATRCSQASTAGSSKPSSTCAARTAVDLRLQEGYAEPLAQVAPPMRRKWPEKWPTRPAPAAARATTLENADVESGRPAIVTNSVRRAEEFIMKERQYACFVSWSTSGAATYSNAPTTKCYLAVPEGC